MSPHNEPTTADEVADVAGAVQANEPKTVAKACHRCGAGLPLDARVCAECGQKLYRHCFCGHVFPSNLNACPECGVEWAKSVRIRRRSHTQRIRPRSMLRQAGIGALIALAVAGVLNAIVASLALRATPDATVPAPFAERLHYAWTGLVASLTKLTTAVIGQVGYALLIALAGALIGATAYWLPMRLGQPRRSSRRGKRRRRRSHR